MHSTHCKRNMQNQIYHTVAISHEKKKSFFVFLLEQRMEKIYE